MVSHPKRGRSGKELTECSIEELRSEAKQLNIPGYATMDQSELVSEIERRRDDF